MPCLPACSPDLNPIGQAWAKLEARLRARAARTIEALDGELDPAIAAITRQDARGWFRHRGYPRSLLTWRPP